MRSRLDIFRSRSFCSNIQLNIDVFMGGTPHLCGSKIYRVVPPVYGVRNLWAGYPPLYPIFMGSFAAMGGGVDGA